MRTSQLDGHTESVYVREQPQPAVKYSMNLLSVDLVCSNYRQIQ